MNGFTRIAGEILATTRERRSLQLAHSRALAGHGEAGLARKLSSCLQEVEVRVREDGKGGIFTIHECGSRYCEACKARDSARHLRHYLPRFGHLVEEGYNLSAVLFTLRSVDSINAGQVKTAFDSIVRLTRQKAYKDSASGALIRFEVNFDATRGTFTPHFHGVIAHSGRLNQRRLRDAWEQLTGNYKVDITPLVSRSSDRVESGEEIASAIKYAVKHRSFDDSRAFATYVRATKGQKLVRTYGVLRQLRVPEGPARPRPSGQWRTAMRLSVLDPRLDDLLAGREVSTLPGLFDGVEIRSH